MFASHIGLGRWAFTGKFWPILSVHSQGALPLTQQASCANSKVNSPVISEAANFSHNSNIRMKALWVKKKKKQLQHFHPFTHTFIQWWQKLPCKVPTCSSGAVSGSVSCPTILQCAAGTRESNQQPYNSGQPTLPPALQPWQTKKLNRSPVPIKCIWSSLATVM